jgi:hypothetical protein
MKTQTYILAVGVSLVLPLSRLLNLTLLLQQLPLPNLHQQQQLRLKKLLLRLQKRLNQKVSVMTM